MELTKELQAKMALAKSLGIIIEQTPREAEKGSYTVKWSNCVERDVGLDEMDEVLDYAIQSRKQLRKSLGYR